ncbi:hypothetical protein SAMN04487906_0180, partial [Zhouia amylolytica]
KTNSKPYQDFSNSVSFLTQAAATGPEVGNEGGLKNILNLL